MNESIYEVVWSFQTQKYEVMPFSVFERDWTKASGSLEHCKAVANQLNSKVK